MHHRAVFLAFLLLPALGCGDRARPPASVGERDDFGAPVRAPATAGPARIVSLSPATTEILFALGVGPRLVGRTRWDLWPPAARDVPDVGDGLRPNIEAVLARRPDLVVLYASADNKPAARRLAAAGITTLSVKIDRIADFRRATRLLGVAVGRPDAARAIVDSVNATLDRVARATAPLPAPSVFWHVWDDPVITIGGGSYLTELIRIAGGRNVYADSPQSSPQVSLEDVAKRDPDVILAGPLGAARIRSDAGWRSVRAVRDGRVLVVDTALVGRPSVRLGEAALSLARLLHPGLTL